MAVTMISTWSWSHWDLNLTPLAFTRPKCILFELLHWPTLRFETGWQFLRANVLRISEESDVQFNSRNLCEISSALPWYSLFFSSWFSSQEQLERLEHERQESQLEMSDLRRSLEELQRSKDNVQLEEELRELREEAEANAGKLSQFRDYQSKAFELKHSNDILSEQLDALQEEMQRMQSDYNDEVEQLKKEIEISQNDRRTHRQAVEEHVEVKIGQLRKEKIASKFSEP